MKIDIKKGTDSLKMIGKQMLGKKGEELNLPEETKTKCEKIIHKAVIGAGMAGAGLGGSAAEVLLDNAVIIPIQIAMVVSLAKVFHKKIDEKEATEFIKEVGLNIAGRGAAKWALSMVPIVGNTVNAVTAVKMTEMIGWRAAERMSNLEGHDMSEEEKAAEKAETERKKEEWIKKANRFLQGELDVKENKEEYKKTRGEYMALQVEIEIDEEEEIAKMFKRLTDLKRQNL